MKTQRYVICIKAFLISIILLNGICLAQDNGKKDAEPKPRKYYFVKPSTYKIVYDFRKGEFLESLGKIRVHTPVVFHLKNINPFAYSINVTKTDSIVAPSSFDEELMRFIRGKAVEETEKQIEQAQATDDQKISNITPIANKDIIGSDTAKKTLNTSVGYVTEITLLEKKLGVLKDSLSRINTDIAVLKSNDSLTTDLTKKLNDAVAQQTALVNKIDSLGDEIKKLNAKVQEDMKLFASLQSDFLRSYYQFMLDCKRVFSTLRKVKAVNTIAEDPNLNFEGYQQSYKAKVNGLVASINIERDSLNDYRASYSELANAYFRLKNDQQLSKSFTENGINKLYAYPDYIKSKADGLHTRISQYPTDDLIKYIDWIASKLNSEHSFDYYSDPIQPVNDLIEFKVDIRKRNKFAPDTYFTERSFVFQQPTHGGTRVDFSLGLAASYFDVSTYSLAFSADSASQGQVIAQDTNLVAASLVGLVTMSLRRTKYVAYGGSAGLGIDVIAGKVQISNFFAGPSMLFGKKDRIFFTFGASLRNTGKLKAGYRVGDNVGKVDDISSFLRDDYNLGWFVALTYSLTKDARRMIKEFR